VTTLPVDPIASSPLYQAMVAGGVDYRPWEGPGLGDDDCFLCSAALNDISRTLEDVVPMWMQRTLGRGRQHPSILLPNLTSIAPEKIKIPACLSCNGQHMSRIENAVSIAFRSGPTAVAALPERTLRIWLAKIAYGTRRNDMRLPHDIRDPASATIATSADLETLEFLHLLLQEARDVVHVPDGHSTIFVFSSQTVGCNVCDFDLALPIGWPYPAMLRFGDVTVMGAVDDRGALGVLHSHPAFVAAQHLALHPVQVRALWALLVHRSMLLRADRVPVRFGVSQGRLWVDRVTPVEAAFDPTLERASADKLLATLLDESEEIVAAHGGAVGLLVDSRRTPREIPLVHGALRLSA
jgi:hypothetical protein